MLTGGGTCAKIVSMETNENLQHVGLAESDGQWAVAQELRTANMIAYANLLIAIDGPTVNLADDLAMIAERLYK